MAECRIDGLDELIEKMARYEGNISSVMEDMLEIGSEEVKQAWKDSAEKHGHKDTGELIENIDWEKDKKSSPGVYSSYIYPRGEQKSVRIGGKIYGRNRPIRRAAIAFYLHYGHRGVPGSHWVDTATQEASKRAGPVLLKRWEEFLKNGN